jgi:hypothetical protein
MAKKNDNTWLWIAAAGIGGYFLYKNLQTPVNSASTTALPAQPAATPVIMLPQSTALQSPLPPGTSNFEVLDSSVPVNVTNLTPAVLATNDTVAPGQPIALNSSGKPVTNNQGIPLTFANSNSLAAQKWQSIEAEDL